VCLNDATAMMPGGGANPEDGGPTAKEAPKGGPRRPRFPPVYSDATRTPFAAVEVKPGTQTLDFAMKPAP
jgi:hypothetical protein